MWADDGLDGEVAEHMDGMGRECDGLARTRTHAAGHAPRKEEAITIVLPPSPAAPSTAPQSCLSRRAPPPTDGAAASQPAVAAAAAADDNADLNTTNL